MNAPIARHQPETLVVFGGSGARTARELWVDVATMMAVLPPSAPEARVLLVFEQDRYAFIVALLAVLARGHLAVVPPDNRRSTLARLNEHCDTVLHDTDSGLKYRVPTVLEAPTGSADEARIALAARWSSGGAAVEMYGATSRTEGRPWRLTSEHFDRELEAVGRDLSWPHGVQAACSVPVASRFGVVWGILRPLAGGGAVHRPMDARPESWPSAVDTWVTVPFALRSALWSAPSSLRAPALERVVSSVTPLDDRTAAALRAQLQASVFDVLTTTATGSVAWRRPSDDIWRPLEGVFVRADAERRLQIGAVEPHRTADLIKPWSSDSGGEAEAFALLGRADAFVRADDGRDVHVSTLAAAVAQMPGVEDVEVVIHVEPEVPLVLVCARGASVDRARIVERIRRTFNLDGAVVEAVVVSKVPRDGLGRLPLPVALPLLGFGREGARRSMAPIFGASSIAEGAAEVTVTVPENYRWFDGHFEFYPVLPAAVQLHELVLPCVARAGWPLGVLRSAHRLKFTGRIEPGAELRVRLRRSGVVGGGDGDGGAVVQFDILAADRSCSSGRLVFSGGAE